MNTKTLRYIDYHNNYIEKDTVWPLDFLTNIDRHLRKFITKAARTTGFSVYWKWGATDYLGHPVKGDVAVYTRERNKDHGPFWKEYDRLTGRVTK